MSSNEETAAQWRERVLGESQRLKQSLLEAKRRRQQRLVEEQGSTTSASTPTTATTTTATATTESTPVTTPTTAKSAPVVVVEEEARLREAQEVLARNSQRLADLGVDVKPIAVDTTPIVPVTVEPTPAPAAAAPEPEPVQPAATPEPEPTPAPAEPEPTPTPPAPAPAQPEPEPTPAPAPAQPEPEPAPVQTTVEEPAAPEPSAEPANVDADNNQRAPTPPPYTPEVVDKAFASDEDETHDTMGEIVDAQLKLLEYAEREVERTNKRISQLQMDMAATEDFDEEPADNNTPQTRDPSQSFIDSAENTWMRLTKTSSINFDSAALDSARSARSVFAKDTTEGEAGKSGDDANKKAGDFAVPSKPRQKEESGFLGITSQMQLTSSPLIFFNLACFQGQSNGNIEVMHPICGYAVAGKLLAVMGPQGTDTSTLRVALGGMPQDTSRDVLVADFTVSGLLSVSEGALRTSDMDPTKSLLEIFELEEAADVVIGTCIQRGVKAGQAATTGTPRGSRTPDAPTPRNPTAATLPGSQAGLYKSVLLMEDLSTLLKAEEIFKILRALRKVSVFERASVVVCLNRDFERRGLFKMFDDVVVFTEDGVSYFGPAKSVGTFCRLIGSPCPENIHITDHIRNISNVAAKYQECPIRQHVSAAIERFTGMREQELPASTPRGTIKGPSKSRPFIARLRKKKHAKDDVPEAFDDSSDVSHAKKLAKRLADERRKMAEQEAAGEKLAVWKEFTELDAKGTKKTRFATFEHMLLDLQQTTAYNRPSCFMNLACFITTEDTIGANINAIQPTVAFASEGCVLGVAGPSGIDASNLLSSLRLGNDSSTVVVDLSVRDAIKIAEFVAANDPTPKSNASAEKQSQDASVQILMAKMMLTACSQEVVGSLIQRRRPNTAPETNIEIGSEVLSTATRSVLVLDNILSLDAQSLYVVLKLIRLIASQARLAVILLLDKAVEQKGLFALLDTVLIFRKEGLFYFGASRHLEDYCRLVDFAVPENTHVMDHVRTLMDKYNPSVFSNDPKDTRTPYTVRYLCCALAKYNSRIINDSTKPPEEGGNLTSRTILPKFRRRNSKDSASRSNNAITPHTPATALGGIVIDEIQSRAESARQKEHMARLHDEMQEEKRKQVDLLNEAVWNQMAKDHAEYYDANSRNKGPLTAGRQSIVAEMNARQSRPSLFFNLASFLPDAVTDRLDILQPICGFATIGQITGLIGPQNCSVVTFADALASADPASEETPRGDTTKSVFTVQQLITLFGDSHLASWQRVEDYKDIGLGYYIQRNVSTNDGQSSPLDQSILVIDGAPTGIPPEIWFELFAAVKKFATQSGLTVLMNLKREGERRGLFDLVDDVLIFDEQGVSYFGPTNRLLDYLNLTGFPVPAGVHPTDFIVKTMKDFTVHDAHRPLTNTSPAVRFKFSPLAEFVTAYTTAHTSPVPQDDSADAAATHTTHDKKKKRLPFIPRRKKTAKQKLAAMEEEAAKRRQSIAESEAEAERQRVAELEAEMVWKNLAGSSANLNDQEL